MSIQSEINRLKQNVSAAFTAIGNKGGTVPSSKVSGNLASAIQSIPEGATVQRKNGTFTTNGDDYVSVDCGFSPDVLILFAPETNGEGEYYNMAFPFGETGETEHRAQCEIMEGIVYCGVTKQTNGFRLDFCNFFTFDWEYQETIYNLTYLAIKYT